MIPIAMNDAKIANEMMPTIPTFFTDDAVP